MSGKKMLSAKLMPEGCFVWLGRIPRQWRRTLTSVAKGGTQMIDKPKPTALELVPCAVCQKEIPKSVALSSEDPDYVPNFCGLDCYEKWSQDQMAVKMHEAGGG